MVHVVLGHGQALAGLADDAGADGGLLYGARHRAADAWMERARDDVVGRQLVRLDEAGDGVRGGHLHLLVDVGRTRVQRTAEDAGERQDVVDLVRVVAAAGGHDGDGLARFLRGDLGVRVGHGEHDGVLGHRQDVGPLEQPLGGQADEDVGALEDVLQGALDVARVRDGGILLLLGVEVGAALVDDALGIAAHDVLRARGQQDLGARGAGRADAGDDDLGLGQVLFDVLRALVMAASITMAVPCWSSWNTGMSTSVLRRRSISKHLGAAMSSRLMPPNVGAIAFTKATISSAVCTSMQMGNASTPPNSLKSCAFPSMTGIAASGPRFPIPKMADPSETTATVFLRMVRLKLAFLSFAMAQQMRATPGV